MDQQFHWLINMFDITYPVLAYSIKVAESTGVGCIFNYFLSRWESRTVRKWCKILSPETVKLGLT